MNRTPNILALVMAGSLGGSAVAHASPEAAAVRIEVEVSVAPETKLPADDQTWTTMRHWVTDNQTAVLEGAGFVVTDDAAEVIRTELHVYGEYGVNTKGTLTAVGDPASQRAFVCEACKDSELLDKIDEQTAALAEGLRGSPSEAEGAESGPAEPEPAAGEAEGSGEAGGGEAVAEGSGPRIGGVGYAGIGALAVGLGVTMGGVIVLAQKPEDRLPMSDATVIESVHRRPLGGALTGVGASVLVAGVAMLVVDQTVLRKRRARGATARLTPSLLPGGAGLRWLGRF